jgi:uncharacterized SAM-binding protein YcdF (DUF218 family)
VSEAAPDRRRAGRLARGALATVLVVGLLLGLLALPLTVFPDSVAVPRDADVVVVLGGGQGERIATARALMDRTVGPPAGLLLLSDVGPAVGDGPNPLCGTAEPGYAIACFVPDPLTTAGEAEAIGRLAERQGWERIAIVTTSYHVTRARARVARCVEAEVVAVAAAPDLPLLERSGKSVRELAALARDALEGDAC